MQQDSPPEQDFQRSLVLISITGKIIISTSGALDTLKIRKIAAGFYRSKSQQYMKVQRVQGLGVKSNWGWGNLRQ